MKFHWFDDLSQKVWMQELNDDALKVIGNQSVSLYLFKAFLLELNNLSSSRALLQFRFSPGQETKWNSALNYHISVNIQ